MCVKTCLKNVDKCRKPFKKKIWTNVEIRLEKVDKRRKRFKKRGQLSETIQTGRQLSKTVVYVF